MPIQKFKELMILKANFKAEKKAFILPGFITANKTKEKCFENFLSPFGNHGNYVKVLFKIQVDLDASQECRSTFLNLHGKGTKQLTLELENEQVLFALPKFAITNYMEFKDEFYPGMSDEDKREYDDLLDKKHDKDDTIKLKRYLFGKTHTEAFKNLDENV
jgi:hypothetical protein